jgi:hypothetical protein
LINGISSQGNKMRIACPVCSISIEVSDSHTGKKGRCTNCRSKFIIPEQSDAEFEILERGEIPADDKQGKSSSILQFPARKKPAGAAARFRLSRRDVSNKATPVLIVSGFLMMAALVTLFTWKEDNGAKKPAETVKKPTASQKANPHHPTGTERAEPALLLDPLSDPSPPSGTPDVAVENTAPIEEKPFELNKVKRTRALAYLKSPQESKRKGAYAALRKLGNKARPIYLQLLEKAKAHHLGKLGDIAFNLSVDENALTDFKETYDNWHEIMIATKAKVQTDWKAKEPQGYGQRHAEMDNEFAEASRLYSQIISRAEQARNHDFSPLQSLMDILVAINRETAWCHDKESGERPGLVATVRKAGGAGGFIEIMNFLERTEQKILERTAVAKHNAGCNWAGGAHMSFATLLNDRRVAINLTPLQLDEDLSRGCRDHSIDMAANGYFSHTGRTSETRTFTVRAKRAGFTGSASGECIFVGNPAAVAAHKAWWYSDGHRLIMYASGPSTLGLGTSGNHWTLNTAR